MRTANDTDKAALGKIVADSGVNITSAELDAVASSLARIKAAAAALLQPTSFDETPESFYRLLEGDGAGEADR
jgi:hypothetical protein